MYCWVVVVSLCKLRWLIFSRRKMYFSIISLHKRKETHRSFISSIFRLSCNSFSLNGISIPRRFFRTCSLKLASQPGLFIPTINYKENIKYKRENVCINTNILNKVLPEVDWTTVHRTRLDMHVTIYRHPYRMYWIDVPILKYDSSPRVSTKRKWFS